MRGGGLGVAATAMLLLAVAACAQSQASGARRRRDAKQASGAPEFEVTFRVRGALGMVLDEYATVAGFRRMPETGVTPAERGGVRVGDAVMSVNGQPVDDPVLAAQLLRAGEDGSPRVLRFRALGGDARDSAVVDLLDADGGGGGGGAAAASGAGETGVAGQAAAPPAVMRYEAGSDGFLQVVDAKGRRERIPFRLAAFSRAPADCDLRRVVSVTPADGCGEVRADLVVRDALVVVDRGGCTFFDKAMNVAWSGAGVVVVANGDDGPLFAMPAGADQDGAAVQAPVVLVSASNGALLRRLSGVAEPVQLAQLVTPALGCSTAQLAALPTQVTMATGAGESQRLRVHADGTVEVGRAAPRVSSDSGGGGSGGSGGGVDGATHSEPSQPKARGGTLFLSAPVAQAMLRADVDALRRAYAARGPLPRDVAATPGAWFASTVGGGGGGEGDVAAADAADAADARSSPAGQSPVLVLAVDFLRADFGGPLVPRPWDEPAPPPPLLAIADPADACSDLRNLDEVEGAVVAVARGQCALADKVRRAQSAGAVGVVVLNTEDGLVAPRAPGPSSSMADVTIPAVMVTKEAGRALQQLLVTVRALAQRRAVEAARARRAHIVPDSSEADAYLSEFRLQAPRVFMFGLPKVAEYWEELGRLHAPAHWPEDAEERRALYKRLAKLHHPDKGGSHDRFALLHEAYSAAEYFKAQLRQGAAASGSTGSEQSTTGRAAARDEL